MSARPTKRHAAACCGVLSAAFRPGNTASKSPKTAALESPSFDDNDDAAAAASSAPTAVSNQWLFWSGGMAVPRWFGGRRSTPILCRLSRRQCFGAEPRFDGSSAREKRTCPGVVGGGGRTEARAAAADSAASSTAAAAAWPPRRASSSGVLPSLSFAPHAAPCAAR